MGHIDEQKSGQQAAEEQQLQAGKQMDQQSRSASSSSSSSNNSLRGIKPGELSSSNNNSELRSELTIEPEVEPNSSQLGEARTFQQEALKQQDAPQSCLKTLPPFGPSCQLASSESPARRRRAQLSIDAALYLQSQAGYVQAPAHSAGSAPLAAGSRLESAASVPELEQLSSAAPKRCQRAHLLPGPLGREQHNVSVDYIDCLESADLVGPPPSGCQRAPEGALRTSGCVWPRTTRQATDEPPEGNMRCLASCGRKHFSRLHRARRVQPHACDQAAQSGRKSDSLAGQPSESSESTLTTVDNSSSGDDGRLLGQSETEGGGQMGPEVAPSAAGLHPISVSEVKKRTYFIGSLGQDSLLGHDELFRYFPQGRVNIFVCTWNQNRKRAPSNLNDLLLPDQLVFMPDIYAIGIQEAFSSQADYLREWDIELQTTLGPNHVLLHSCSLGVLHLSIFIRRDLIWFCSTPEESVYNSRSMPTNMIKTKGSVSIAFRFFGTSFMFTNCHFPAHENKLKDRIEEYQRIINSIDLPKDLKLLKPRYLSNDSTARFDCVFLIGDLNFRLEQRTFDETIQILDDIFHTQPAPPASSSSNGSNEQHNNSYEILTQNDELLKVMETQQAFHGFQESQIKFPPTYKFLAHTNKYDRQTKRVPSYTDRILYRSKRQRHIQCLLYDWLPQLISSDHKPVFSLFDVLVRPGRDQNMVSSLNAGLFQRPVYIEALKRRAEDPEGMGRENGVGANLICSIS